MPSVPGPYKARTRSAATGSSYSGDNGGRCVEVATHPYAVHVRDSDDPEDPEGPALTFTSEAWASFVEFARSV